MFEKVAGDPRIHKKLHVIFCMQSFSQTNWHFEEELIP